MAFLTGIVQVTDSTGKRIDVPDANGDHAPISLEVGPNMTATSTPLGSLTKVSIDAVPGGGGGTTNTFATYAAFRASTPVDGEVFTVRTGQAGPWVYSSTTGAGLVDDGAANGDLFATILKPTAVSLGSNGRAYNVSSSPVLPTIASLRLATAGPASVQVFNYATPGDGGGGIFDLDGADSTSADNGGTIIVAGSHRYKRRYAGKIDLAWFGAKNDVHFTTCKTTAATNSITVLSAVGAVIGQTIAIRAVRDTALATHVALTGIATNATAGVPAAPWPYAIGASLFTCSSHTFLSPKELHRYIEIPGVGQTDVPMPVGGNAQLFRSFISDVGGTDNGGHKRSPLAATYSRLNSNIEDALDPLPDSGRTGTLGGDNFYATITNVVGNVITLSANPDVTFSKVDCAFGTPCNTALEAALATGKHIVISKLYLLNAFTNNHETEAVEWTRDGQLLLTGEFASNGNHTHWIGHTSGAFGGAVPNHHPEMLYVGPVKGIGFHPAAGTPPSTPGVIQTSYADQFSNIGIQNLWLTPHATPIKVGQDVIGVGSYGTGGAQYFNIVCIDFHAGAARAFWYAHASQQVPIYGLRLLPTDPSQNGSGGNLGRGVGFFSGAHGTGANTATWLQDGTIEGFACAIDANSCDTTRIANLVVEDMTILGAYVVRANEVNSFEVTGWHMEDTGLVPVSLVPPNNAARNRFILLGQAQENAHAQFAAGAPINASTAFTITDGPRRIKAIFGAGTIAAVTVTVVGTDYTGNTLTATFVPTPGAGPRTVEGYGLDLYDSITSVTSNIDPGVTVDIVQAGHTAIDVVVHDLLRMAGTIVYADRRNSDGFVSIQNQISQTNDSVAFPSVYFLATDNSARLERLRLGPERSVGQGANYRNLANASYVAVADVPGLMSHEGDFVFGEFANGTPNVPSPAIKFPRGPLYIKTIDSRDTLGVQGPAGHFKGLWTFDSAQTFAAGLTVVGNLNGSGGSIFWHDAGIPQISVIDTSGIFVLPEHAAVASGNPYGDGSNVLQRTIQLWRQGFWDPTGTPQARTVDVSLGLVFDTRQTAPLTHLQIVMPSTELDLYWDGTNTSLGIGGGAPSRWYNYLASEPTFSATTGSFGCYNVGTRRNAFHVNVTGGGAGTTWAAVDLTQPAAGTNLTDADQTVTPGSAVSQYTQLTPLTASRTKTVNVTGLTTGQLVRIIRRDTAAFTMLIVNGGPGAGTAYTFPVSSARIADFYFDGTDLKYGTNFPIDQ